MSISALRIEQLCKTYHSKKATKEALKSFSIDVPKGAFYGLLGPNGAGKSTFINILAGLVVKTSGKASINGFDIDTHTRQARKSIGIVPQELMLDPFFPPFEALEFYAGLYGIPQAERRTAEILEAVGLTEHSKKHARKLSGGMRRRLLVAKALVHSPEVLILDEPTAGVDVELRDQLWSYVKELNERGTTILLTTHYLEEAEELCDRIAVINHGELIAEDSTSNLLGTLDQKYVEITPESTIASIPEKLQPFAPVINKQGKLVLTYKSSEYSFDAILAAVANSSIVIKDLSTKEADLEEVFKHLTRAA